MEEPGGGGGVWGGGLLTTFTILSVASIFLCNNTIFCDHKEQSCGCGLLPGPDGGAYRVGGVLHPPHPSQSICSPLAMKSYIHS